MQLPISFWPRTRLGWWAVGIMMTFVVLFVINASMMAVHTSEIWWMQTVLPIYGIFMVLCALGGGICGVVAWRRAHDYSFAVMMCMIPLILFTLFLAGEFLIPH